MRPCFTRRSRKVKFCFFLWLFRLLEAEVNVTESKKLPAFDWDSFDLRQKNSYTVERISKNGHLLQYIPRELQTHELCLAAVNNRGLTLLFVEEQTPEICLAAVKENSFAIRYAKQQTEELCIVAVSDNGRLLWMINNQTQDVCIAAVMQNYAALDLINDPELKSKVYNLYTEKYKL